MKYRRLFFVLLGVALSVVSLAIVASFVDIPAALAALQAANPLPIAAALAVIASSLVIRAVRWSLLLGERNGSRISPVALLAPLLIGYLGNTILPARMGEVIRSFLVARRERVQFSRTFGTVLLERVMDLATLALVGAVVAFASGAPSWISQSSTIVATGGLLAVGLLVFVGIGRTVQLVGRFLGERGGLAQRVMAFLTALGEGAGGQPRRVVLAALAITGGAWLFEGTTFWLMGQAVGALGMTWPVGMLVAAVTVLGTAVPSAPGYIGTFELAAVAAATALGVPAEQALAAAILAHVFTSLPIALAGAVSLARMSVSLRSLAAASDQQAPFEAVGTPPATPRR